MAGIKSKKLQPEEYLRQHYEQKIRPDGRPVLTSLRPVSISTGSINTADGSAVVMQGETMQLLSAESNLKLLNQRQKHQNQVT